MKKLYFVVLSVLLLCCKKNTTEVSRWKVTSPDNNVELNIFLDSGRLSYEVGRIEGEQRLTLIERSPLGITQDGEAFDTTLSFAGADSVDHLNYNYNLLTGKRLSNRVNARQQILHLKNESGKMLDLHLRVANDGVAFRYAFSEADSSTRKIISENTGFKLPVDGKAWLQPYDTVTKWSPGYEQFYTIAAPIGSTSPKQNGWCFPALFETSNGWVLITESDAGEQNIGSHMNPRAPNGLYTIRNPENTEAMGLGNNITAFNGQFQTPWRTIIVGKTLGQVFESNFVNDVAVDPKQDDFSWVKPGRASWSWWSDHDSSRDYNKLKSFIDLAARMGWEYSLVDANWNVMKGGTVEQLAAYAQKKNIGLWLWYNSGGKHNEVEEQPRNIMSDPEARKAEFKRIRAMGVKGIKVDFFQSDKQFIMQQYLDILKDAAAEKIMVNFHGCTIPRGWQKTWPNLVSMESVRGAESYSFAKDYPENAPAQNTVFPFTRNVIGSMDYTPVTFSNQTYPHLTTYAHELALPVIFESGVLHVADNVKSIDGLPTAAKSFLKEVPVVWNDTKFVSGYPGKDAVIARRKDDRWYIAGINGENIQKTISLNFTFLDEHSYEATLITDGANERQFSSLIKNISKQSNEAVTTLPYGGFVIILKRAATN